ncbi:hypothetical protein HELRODRAFT_164572 [Helobdella robusta]|uniref:BED-type domain-containing protein n=1 Tax=Helobdella robusta TaxID=6412 RepID=T1EVL1_HELRO|nr:hypothetical protein HELRODRAFT_164572 [Helobdella robusta]ESN94689.1 hypothetical protein HELRODRAFT_164572 [Helobdella robusta]
MSLNPIWKYFTKIQSDKSKARCDECDKLYSLGSTLPKNQTVFGLKNHLEKYHKDDVLFLRNFLQHIVSRTFHVDMATRGAVVFSVQPQFGRLVCTKFAQARIINISFVKVFLS